MLEELRIGLVSSLNISTADRPADQNTACSIDFLTRHIRQYGKLFRRLQQLNCPKFVALNASPDLVLYYWSKVVQATNGSPEFIAGKFQFTLSENPSLQPLEMARLTVCSLSGSLHSAGNGSLQRESWAMELDKERDLKSVIL